MSNKIEPRTLSGFMELLPKDQIMFNNIKEVIRRNYEKFGFLPLDTPVIELSEVLLAKAGGETEKQIYRFTKGDNDLSLRFDLTVPLAKYIALNYNELEFPFRRYQIGKVYRGERPQKGRFREFYQCDIDIIGNGELSIINDAEIPSIIYSIFSELDFGPFTININNRKILNGFFENLGLKDLSVDIMRIIDKIDKMGLEKVKEELAEIQISEDMITKILDFILIEGTNAEKVNKLKNLEINNEMFIEGLKEIEEVLRYVSKFGVPEECCMLNLKISRGLDYYTGTVYETFLNEYRDIGSVCSGGRYDNLAEYYTSQKLPGVGISIGLTRLFYKLNEMNLIKKDNESITKALIVSMDNDLTDCIEIAKQLRNQNINAEIFLDDKKIKSKFKYADRLKIPYVVIVGEEEKQTKMYTVKNMSTSEQKKMEINGIIDLLK